MTNSQEDPAPGDSTLPLKQAIELAIRATQLLADFASDRVVPIFTNQPPSHSNAAIQTTYNRMVMWMSDLSLAKEPTHIQIVSVCTRSIFEHLLDLKWLLMNPTAAKAFNAYTSVRRFDIADKIRKEFSHHREVPIPLRWSVELANDPKKRAIRDELCVRHGWVKKNGKPRSPVHWWLEKTEQRAHAVDPENRKYTAAYATLYGWTSNQIHPGGVGLVGVSGIGVANLFVGLQFFAQDFFREATDLVLHKVDGYDDVKAEYRERFSDTSLIA